MTNSPSTPAPGGMFREKGFTLLELVVVAVVIGVLVAVFLDRVLFYQEQVEKVVMETTARNIRSGLRLRLADMVIHNRRSEISLLAGENPINWLATKPGNYLGEYDGSKPEEIQASGWYFDAKDKTLVYLPDMAEHFQPDSAGRKRVRYRVAPVYERDKENGVAADNKIVEDVELELREPYRWF